MAFSDTWNALQANLSAGTVIPNWTVHSGPIGEAFTVTDVSSSVVLVDAPGAETLQRVPRMDFEAVYARWDVYTRRELVRSHFNPLTRHSKYVISILHWLESRTGGTLP